MSKYLIINADDYGYNEKQTKAIRELYKDKLITSCSVIAVAPDAVNAARFAAEDKFPVGVHLTINSDDQDKRWRSISGRRSLSDFNGLYAKQWLIAIRAGHKDVAAELEAQYNYLIARGCIVDHADNHCGTLYGINGRRFYADAYRFCAEHNLPYRFPKNPGFLERQLGRRVPRPVAALHGKIVREGEKRGIKMIDDLVSNPYSIKKIQTYDNLRDYYLRAVDDCIDGVTEMFLHPSYPVNDEESEWTKRVYELRLLNSGDILQRAHEKGVEVVSWGIFKASDSLISR